MISAESSEERLLRIIRNNDKSFIEAHGHQFLPDVLPAKEFTVKSSAGRQPLKIHWEWGLLILLGIALAIGPSMVYRYQKSAAAKNAAQPPDKTQVAAVSVETPESPGISELSPAQTGPVAAHVPLTTAAIKPRTEVFVPELTAPVTMTARPAEADVYQKFRILGLVIGADSNAILEDRQTKQVYTVNVGSRIGDILVKDIRPDRVLFAVGDDILELTQ